MSHHERESGKKKGHVRMLEMWSTHLIIITIIIITVNSRWQQLSFTTRPWQIPC